MHYRYRIMRHPHNTHLPTGVRGQPTDQLAAAAVVVALHTWRPHRHVRAQDIRTGRRMGHQLLRPVGVRSVGGYLVVVYTNVELVLVVVVVAESVSTEVWYLTTMLGSNGLNM